MRPETQRHLAHFHTLPLTIRLARLLQLPAADRALIARELHIIRATIKQAHARRRSLPARRLDRYARQAADVLADRRPIHALLTAEERQSA